jgi:hypothetical protein
MLDNAIIVQDEVLCTDAKALGLPNTSTRPGALASVLLQKEQVKSSQVHYGWCCRHILTHSLYNVSILDGGGKYGIDKIGSKY